MEFIVTVTVYALASVGATSLIMTAVVCAALAKITRSEESPQAALARRSRAS